MLPRVLCVLCTMFVVTLSCAAIHITATTRALDLSRHGTHIHTGSQTALERRIVHMKPSCLGSFRTEFFHLQDMGRCCFTV